MAFEPFRRKIRDAIERAGLLEKMRRARYQDQTILTFEARDREPVKPHDGFICAADDHEQRRATHFQRISREIYASAARNNGANLAWAIGGGDNRRGCAGTCAEKTGRQAFHLFVFPRRVDHCNGSICEQRDVESQCSGSLVFDLFFGRQQIPEKRCKTMAVEDTRDMPIARAQAAASAAMDEYDEAVRVLYNGEIAGEFNASGPDRDGTQRHRLSA